MRCPIHRVRLLDVCPHCKRPIAYRVTAAFAAHPLACPLCAHPFLPDPTVLARQSPNDLVDGPLLKWQHYLAHYAYWFIGGTPSHRDDAGRFLPAEDRKSSADGDAQRLSFIAPLQDGLVEPPPLPLPGSIAADAAGPGSAGPHLAREPPFSREDWPHFYTRDFLALYHRYARAQVQQQRLEHPDHQLATLCWRRTWNGAIARACAVGNVFAEPPFGIAEWLAFADPVSLRSPAKLRTASLVERFDEDLVHTWTAWMQLLQYLGPQGIKPHPRLVPARACWLGSPDLAAEAPALGSPRRHGQDAC